MNLNRQHLFFVATIALAIFLSVIAFRILGPNRNWFGNPASERIITNCLVPDSEAVVRLYRGYHSSITGRDWTSVTYQPTGERPEKQFFYSYGAPFITEIQCNEESVYLGFGSNYDLSFEFPLTEIETKLTRRPRGLRYGEIEVATMQLLRILRISLAGSLFLVSAGLLIFATVKMTRKA